MLKIWIVELSNEAPLTLQRLRKQQSSPGGHGVTGLARSEWSQHSARPAAGLASAGLRCGTASSVPSSPPSCPSSSVGATTAQKRGVGRTPARLALAPLHELCAIFRWPAPYEEPTQNKQRERGRELQDWQTGGHRGKLRETSAPIARSLNAASLESTVPQSVVRSSDRQRQHYLGTRQKCRF